MNLIKRTSAIIIVCLLLYGCGFFAAAGKKVSQYCPGLNLKITGFSISINNGREVTVVDYPDSYQKKVNAYFSDKTHGFSGTIPRRYDGLRSNDETQLADGDSVQAKPWIQMQIKKR